MAGKYFIRLCAERDTETCETDMETAVEQGECVCSDVKADIKAHLAPFFFCSKFGQIASSYSWLCQDAVLLASFHWLLFSNATFCASRYEISEC